MAITAVGMVSPLGADLPETVASLRAGKDCVAPVTGFSTERTRCQTAAQIPNAVLDGRNLSRHDLHRVSHMLIAAADELTQADPAFAPEIAIVGTTSGGMSFGEKFFRALRPQLTTEIPRWVANYPPQKQIADALETRGWEIPAQIIANACASGSNALGHAFETIRAGRYQRVLAGGYDGISELVFVGFDSLQAATPDRCRPFDAERTGMVLGEGAALFALEELESARARGAVILGELVGYGISTDNYHLTQPNPDGSGPRAAMQRALDSAGITADRVGYINAHGTATVFNDASEGNAIAEIFGDHLPVSSTKGMMGHSLGAAGAIEAAISLLALRNDFLPPNINFRALDSALSLDIVANDSRPARIDYALSNSFGFGGTNASIVLRKV